jgi:hypothetical protein
MKLFAEEDPKPTIHLPARIFRSLVQKNPQWIFVYSNDYQNKGCEGMAWHFYGEPNAFMVPTMKKMCRSATDKYWRDDVQWIQDVVIEAIAKIPRDNRPIIPVRKMGWGCSRMAEFAPKLHLLMWTELNKIAYPNIEWAQYL